MVHAYLALTPIAFVRPIFWLLLVQAWCLRLIGIWDRLRDIGQVACDGTCFKGLAVQ